MKIAQFKKMLALHGADMTRWEGVDTRSAYSFMEASPQAQELYRQARALDQALDHFQGDACDPALLDRVMRRIDEKGNTEKTAAILSFPAGRKMPSVSRPVFWGGTAAIAAAVLLFVSVVPLPSPRDTKPAVTAAADISGTRDVEIMLAALEQMSEEDIAQREMIALLRTAAAAQPKRQQDMDSFLDEIFSDSSDNAAGQDEEMELWRTFLQNQDVREL